MIKFEDTKIYGMKEAILAIRNSTQTWDRSDTYTCDGNCEACENKCIEAGINAPVGTVIGPTDMELVKRLARSESDERKFLRQIFIHVNITAPLYWWKQFDTYKVGTVSNSESTMKNILNNKITLDSFSTDKMDDRAKAIFEVYIEELENIRVKYFTTAIEPGAYQTTSKQLWWDLIQMLPSSYNQMRTITMNYENARNMFTARKNHKLTEWCIGFVEWVRTLPYAKELITLE